MVFIAVFLILLLDEVFAIQGNCGGDTDFETWLENSPNKDEFELKMVQAYIRHGDRTLAYELRKVIKSNQISPINWIFL